MANGFSQEFSFLPAELVFKTHEFVRAYHKIHGSGWLFVRKAHIRAAHSAYLTGLERRIVIEGIIFRIALGCIFVFAVAALFLNIWLGALSAIAILIAFFLARQTKFDLVQERALIIATEMLSIDFAGWGTLFPSARDEARKWLEDNPFGVEAKLLDTYMPAEKRSGFIDDFRPSEQSVRLAATGGRGNSEIPLWAAFRGKPNTANLLQEKAMVVVALITRVLDDGVVLASEWMQDRKMGDREAVRAKVETAAFWLRVIDEIGFMCLNPADRDTFMDALEAGVTKELGWRRETNWNPTLSALWKTNGGRTIGSTTMIATVATARAPFP